MKKTTQKQQEFDESVLEYIRHCNRRGWKCDDWAIHIHFSISERRARESIARLRRTHAILNFQDGNGYILPNALDELGQAQIARWKAQEFSRSMSILMGLKGATMAQSDPNQLKIDMDGFVSELLEACQSEKTVVERYFEAMKMRCDNGTCYGRYEYGRCPFYDVCDIVFSDGFICFSDLTPAQIAALEPYAIKWAESEGTK